jgi:hypothetical protein
VKAYSGYTPGRLVDTVRAAIDLPCALILARTDGPPMASGETPIRSGPPPA